MSPLKRPSHFLRFEWADQWWEPSVDVLQMALTTHRPRPDVLEVTLFGHATPLPLTPTPVRIRCSWDGVVYWVGTSSLWVLEIGAGGGEPTLEYTFHGQFERE